MRVKCEVLLNRLKLIKGVASHSARSEMSIEPSREEINPTPLGSAMFCRFCDIALLKELKNFSVQRRSINISPLTSRGDEPQYHARNRVGLDGTVRLDANSPES